MNRDCSGSRFTLNKKVYYRCLRDGLVLPIKGKNGSLCPNCKRKIDADDLQIIEDRIVRTRVITTHDGVEIEIPFDLGESLP